MFDQWETLLLCSQRSSPALLPDFSLLVQAGALHRLLSNKEVRIRDCGHGEKSADRASVNPCEIRRLHAE